MTNFLFSYTYINVYFISVMIIKETRSVTMKHFSKIFVSFEIICKNSIELCFHNKNVQYS